MRRYTPGFVAMPTFRSLEELLERDVNRGGAAARPRSMAAPAFQTSELWPRMYTEIAAVNGVAYSVGVIVLAMLSGSFWRSQVWRRLLLTMRTFRHRRPRTRIRPLDCHS